MPVKVRCSGCSTVLNVPDKAAGKTISCPKCKEKIKVPASGGAGGPAPKKPAEKSKPARPKDEGDIFGGMKIDDYDMDHDEEQICPYCAAEMDYDDDDELIPVCPSCGMNIETGEMDAKEKKRRARKGPPLEEYWGKAWSESWKFIMAHPGLCVRTGLYTALFSVMATTFAYLITQELRIPIVLFYAGCYFICSLGGVGWYWVLSKKIITTTVMKEELQTDRIFFDMFECMSVGLRALIWPYIVMLPLIQPFFYFFMYLLIVLLIATTATEETAEVALALSVVPIIASICLPNPAAGGWGTLALLQRAWSGFRFSSVAMVITCSISIWYSGMPFDAVLAKLPNAILHPAVTLGFASPPVELQPTADWTGVLGLLTAMPVFIGIGLVYLMAVSFFPIAQVHFTSRYTYKGWILWELLKLLPKNMGGALYWVLVAFVISLPAIIVSGGTFLLLGSSSTYTSPLLVGNTPTPNIQLDEEKGVLFRNWEGIIQSTDFKDVGVTGKITLWLVGFMEVTDPNSAWYYLVKGMINLSFAFMIYIPLGIFSGFGLVYAMKANAVFAEYYLPTLGLVQRVLPNTPATFWVRYLSHNVDILLYPFSGFIVTADARAITGAWVLNALGIVIFIFNPGLIGMYINIWAAYNWWMYWVIQECSPLRTTIGKDGFGLIVIQEDSEKPITFQQGNIRWFMRNISYSLLFIPFLIAAGSEKRTMHDKVSKTRVVWKGDK